MAAMEASKETQITTMVTSTQKARKGETGGATCGKINSTEWSLPVASKTAGRISLRRDTLAEKDQ